MTLVTFPTEYSFDASITSRLIFWLDNDGLKGGNDDDDDDDDNDDGNDDDDGNGNGGGGEEGIRPSGLLLPVLLARRLFKRKRKNTKRETCPLVNPAIAIIVGVYHSLPGG